MVVSPRSFVVAPASSLVDVDIFGFTSSSFLSSRVSTLTASLVVVVVVVVMVVAEVVVSPWATLSVLVVIALLL